MTRLIVRQFTFTPKTYWTNDPNGMVYFRWRISLLFYQYNPGAELGTASLGFNL
ncbi:MAG: hypothetical protein ACLUHA_11675, partial [Bacteroides stercoris]